MTTMQAVVKAAAAPGLEVRQVPIPSFGPRDVLVRVHTASICGTDLHIYNWDPWSAGRIQPPLTIGHEFCGHVAKVGAEVENLREGDFVSAEMHVVCGICFQCRTGESHICQRVKVLGVDAPGCFAEYVRIPASNIVKLDPAVSPDYGSILDPLGNAVHTVLAGPIGGRSVAIIGCGPIGLMGIAVARACGAAPVIAIEVNSFRRELARQLKADLILDPAAGSVQETVDANTFGGGVDAALEFSGSHAGVRSALQLARPGGRVSLLGIPATPLELDLSNQVILKGLTVQGIFGRRMYETWYQMIALLRQNKLDLAPLFTDRLPLARIAEGMEKLRGGAAGKVLLTPKGGA